VGDWSKPVKDAEGYILRGRLILYDTPHYTNTFQGASPTEYWGNAPLFLELENLSPRTDKSLAVYFALQDGLECDLRDSRGWQVTNSIFGFTSGSLRPWFRSYWITVPLDGSVRLRADPQRGGHSPKAGGLEIELSLGQRWIIPAGDMSAYYLRQFQPAVESSGAAWLPCVAGQTHAATHEDNRPQAMKSRKLILLPVLFTGVAGVFAILLWNSHPAEPVYEGKSLSEWLPAFDYANRDVPGLSPRDASRAVRAAGTNAFPTLFRMLRATDSPLKLKLVALLKNQKQITLRITTAENLQHEAETALQLLGPQARAAEPELIKMCDENLSSGTKCAVVSVLAYSFHPSAAAIPALQRATTNVDLSVRSTASNALSNLRLSNQGGYDVTGSMLTSLRAKHMQNALQLFYDFPANYLFGNGGRTDASMLPMLLTTLEEQPDNYWVKFILEQVDHATAAKVLTNREPNLDSKLRPVNDPPESAGSSPGPANTLRLLAAGDWSAPVKPSPPYTVVRGRLLVYEPPHYANRSGEWWGNLPVELELQDQTPALEILPTSAFFEHKTGLDCELRDAQGNRAPAGPALSESVPAPEWVTVPFDGTVRFRVDRFNVARRTKPDGSIIQVGTNSWRIPAGDTNTWFLSATFRPETNHPNPIDYEVWPGTIQLPPVKIPPLRR
jgi:hypothetical protein